MVVRSRNLALITLVDNDHLHLGEIDPHATMRMKSDDPVMEKDVKEAMTNLQLQAINLKALGRDC